MPVSPRRRALFVSVLCVLALAACEGVARVLPARLTTDRGSVVREITGDDSFVSDGEVPGWDINPQRRERVGHALHHEQVADARPGLPRTRSLRVPSA